MKTNRPKLAIYGGAFNPPTLGHLAAANAILNSGFDRVIVMPCYGHTFGKDLAPAADRLLMATECFGGLSRIRVSSFEIDLGMNGSTFELVQKLPMFSEMNTHDIYMAIGSDEANLIQRWRRNEELRRMIPFVVVPRTNYEIDHGGAWARTPPHMIISGEPLMPDISSTKVRQALAQGDGHTLRQSLAARVHQYITERQLYPTHPSQTFG